MFRAIICHLSLFCFIAGMSAAHGQSKTTKKVHLSPITMKLRKSFKFIYDEIETDISRYERYLEQSEDKLAKAKSDEAKDKFRDISTLLKDMIEAHKSVEGMFYGTSQGMEYQNAMRRIPDLEMRLRLDAKIKIERKWLTADEVRKRLKAGLKYRKCPPGVLPYSKDIWYRPKETSKGR